MSLNYNTELALINTTTNSGTITLPSAITVPGRVISFKDSAGNFLTNNFTLICDGSDTFEDGTTQKVFNESFGSIQVVASGTKWFILSGVRQNTMTISSLIVSSISTYSISFSDGSFQTVSADKNINSSITGLGTLGYISTSQLVSTTVGLVDHAELNSSIIGLGTLSYLSSFNSISSLNISTGSLLSGLDITTPALSTTTISTSVLNTNSINAPVNINIGKSLIPFSGNNLDLGNAGAFRWRNLWVSTISSIHTQTSTLNVQTAIITSSIGADRLTGGSASIFNTFTNNLFPASVAGSVGYGNTTGGGGFYSQGTFRSTFTQVIHPALDSGIYSNIVRIQGNTLVQNLNASTIFASTISTNTLTTQFLLGAGPIAGPQIYTNTLLPNGSQSIGNAPINSFQGGWFNTLNVQTIRANTNTGDSINSTVRVLGTLSTQNQMVSSINLKQYPYTSTLNIPFSTFTITGTNARTPIVLYSNVEFLNRGWHTINQKAVLSKNSGIASTDIYANIYYSIGTFPSTITDVDGYDSLPSINLNGVSTFNTLTTQFYISTPTTRNILYHDFIGNNYVASLFMSPLIDTYIPSFGIRPE